MEELSEGKEICPMGEGSVLQKLGTVRLQSTDATTNAVDTVMLRTGQIPHGLEVGFKQVIPLTGETAHPFPTAEPAVLRDLQRPGETGAKRPLGVQMKDHRVNKGPLKAPLELLPKVATDPLLLLPRAAEALTEALPGLLQWVATDPSALLREASVGLLLLPPWVAEVLREALLEPLPWVAADPLLLLPRVAEALTEALPGLLKEEAVVVVVLAATGSQ
jgi:hypothetical protein